VTPVTSVTSTSPTQPPSSGARIAGGVAGIGAAVASAFVSFGVSLVAVLAVLIGWLIARRRGRPFTRGASWLVGVSAVGAVILIVFGALATQLPANMYGEMRRMLDSAQAAPPPPPPEWLRKITPPNAQQQTPITNSLIKSRAFTIWTGVMGVTFTVALLAAYAGTLGWSASLLLLYGATGQWLPRKLGSESTGVIPARGAGMTPVDSDPN
jgi:hypothetical protein